ncbi:uncharacterized protein LOC143146139 [Ptiloglossa arizonensis]|uniref:uncharacterized protein LOC143146139 n=1 Tax=Ptiloglossa arizonensis TaxID=3350558 RepID=UPI003FA088E9
MVLVLVVQTIAAIITIADTTYADSAARSMIYQSSIDDARGNEDDNAVIVDVIEQYWTLVGSFVSSVSDEGSIDPVLSHCFGYSRRSSRVLAKVSIDE